MYHVQTNSSPSALSIEECAVGPHFFSNSRLQISRVVDIQQTFYSHITYDLQYTETESLGLVLQCKNRWSTRIVQGVTAYPGSLLVYNPVIKLQSVLLSNF